jgi:hypothetical protein
LKIHNVAARAFPLISLIIIINLVFSFRGTPKIVVSFTNTGTPTSNVVVVSSTTTTPSQVFVPSFTAVPSVVPTQTPTKVPIDEGTIIPELGDDGNAYNGYWWNNEGWVPGLITFETQFLRIPDVVIGSAVFYAPYVMEATVEYRGLPYDPNYYVGSVAIQFCSEIGHVVWLQRPEKEWEGPFLVADCSRRNDLYGHIMFRDQSVEVDFETALRWGMVRYGGDQNDGRWSALTSRLDGVIVSRDVPAGKDDAVIDLSLWFPEKISYAKISENHHQIENYVPPGYNGMVWQGLGFINPSKSLPMWRINGEWITFP